MATAIVWDSQTLEQRKSCAKGPELEKVASWSLVLGHKGEQGVQTSWGVFNFTAMGKLLNGFEWRSILINIVF